LLATEIEGLLGLDDANLLDNFLNYNIEDVIMDGDEL
jgi:hypothetical protein